MALVIHLDVSASPQTVQLDVATPVEQTVNGDYEQLANLPQINGVTLTGDKSAEDLGLVDADEYDPEEKTEGMTQPVGVDGDGKLWTAPAPSEDVFVAEYGVTTYAEITAARNEGKACFMRGSELGLVAMYAEIGMGTPPGGSGMGSAYIFNATADGKVYSYYCWSSGVWEERYSPIGTYSKPSGGIPKSDLASDVRTSLGKADTALQAVPNTYRTAADQNLIDLAQDDAISDAGTRIGDIEAVIPSAASASNQLADKAFVNSSVQTNTAHFRGNWPTWADVPTNAADYPADDDGNTTPTTNDYMVIQDAADYPVAAGEDALSGTWRFKYTGLWVANGRAGWRPEYQVNETPLTAAQLAALNSGATAEIISSVGNKLDKTGDGSNVTATFTAAPSRTAIATGEKLSVLFGKVLKWLSDLGTAAFRAATATIESGSTALIESGAVHTALGNKQDTLAQKQTNWYAVCNTAAATLAKTVTISGITELTEGLAIRVKFTNKQNGSGTPTLQVNSLAAANIRRLGGANAARYEWQDGEILDLVYDGTYWVIEDGGLASTSYYGATKLNTSATSTSEAYALTPKSLNSLAQGMIAGYAVYSSSATYAVGDRVRYGYQLWQCNTEITTAESWTAAHWTAISPLIDLIEGKYTKPSGGIPASDLASGVIPTVPSASDTAPQDLAAAAAAGSSNNYSRADHKHKNPSPADIGAEPAVEVITVSGSTPSITAVAGKRYVCGEVSTLTIAVPASGIIDVIFESGTTATVLTITPATGHTVTWANGFDPTSLDASTKYELNIMDGLGVAASWT